jgi:Domain of unknown function (DUF4386)
MTTTQPAPPARTARAATTDAPDASTRAVRRAALVSGVGILVLAVLAGVAYVGVIQGLVTTGDATRTATDLLASAGLFRLAVAAFVVVVALDIVVARSLRTFFAPVHAELATLAAWLRLSYAAIFAVAISQLVGVLPLLRSSDYAGFDADQRHTQALLKIDTFQDIWNVGYILFGLHLVLIGYLAYRSGYVPRVIGVLLVVAGGGYLIDSFGALLIENYSITVASFSFVGEALLMVWLLVKGRTITPTP